MTTAVTSAAIRPCCCALPVPFDSIVLSPGLMSAGQGQDRPNLLNRSSMALSALTVSAVVAEFREALFDAELEADTCSSINTVTMSPG